MSPRKVMVVDNEQIIRQGLCQALSWAELGFEVTATAKNGREALDLLEQAPFDLILSDIRMPEVNGLELAREVQRRWPTTKVILITGFAEFEYAQEALQYGVADFVVKPTGEEKLRAAVLKARDLLDLQERQEGLKEELKQTERSKTRVEKELFFRTLLEGERLSLVYMLDQAARLKINLKQAQVAEVRLTVQDKSKEALEHALKEARRFLGMSIPEEDSCVLQGGDDSLLVVLLNQDRESAARLLANFLAFIDGFADFDAQVGVSKAIMEPLGFREAARQAHDAQVFLTHEGDLACLFYDQLPEITSQAQERLSALAQRFQLALKHRERGEAKAAILAFSRLAQSERLPWSETQRYALLLHHLMVSALVDHEALAQPADGILITGNFLSALSADNLIPPLLSACNQAFDHLKGRGEEGEDVAAFIAGFIRANLQTDLSLESLAERAHLSPSYLSRLFKRSQGQNISAYIQEARVKKAQELLLNTQLKAYEIAQAVGLEDPVYFSRMFKKATGQSPSEFRERPRKEEGT